MDRNYSVKLYKLKQFFFIFYFLHKCCLQRSEPRKIKYINSKKYLVKRYLAIFTFFVNSRFLSLL